MESESCKQRQSKRRKEKSRKSKIFDPETGIESNNKDKEDAIKKEQEESTDDEDEDMNFRNNEIGLHNFQSNYVKNECEDSTEIIDQSCITSSESTVEQFDQLDVNTEDDYVDSSELLISEVQKRPLLYDLNLEDYNDRNKKAKCWEEVYKQMITNWSELSSAEKNNRGRIIQKRWRSIRDSFMKAYKKMISKDTSKNKSTKGKRYVYFDQMMFIIPTIEKRKNSENYYPEELNLTVQQECNFEEDNTFDLQSYDLQTNNSSNDKMPARKRQKKDSYDVNLLELLANLDQGTKPQETDEDKMFLLSLLPSFKKMSEDLKLSTKIEVLQILRRALQTTTFPTPTVTQNVQSSCQQQQFSVTNNQQINQTWPSCQQTASSSTLNAWPDSSVSHSEQSVESQLLDLYQ